MFQRECVPQRMDALLERALEEHVIARRLFGKLGIEPVRGHDRYAIAVACVTEDERMRRLIEIAAHDAKQKSVARWIRAEHPVEDGIEEELAAREVGVRGREG